MGNRTSVCAPPSARDLNLAVAQLYTQILQFLQSAFVQIQANFALPADLFALVQAFFQALTNVISALTRKKPQVLSKEFVLTTQQLADGIGVVLNGLNAVAFFQQSLFQLAMQTAIAIVSLLSPWPKGCPCPCFLALLVKLRESMVALQVASANFVPSS